jgi:predicted RNase H-like HicB family nuclease
MAKKSYTVTYKRDEDGWWVAHIKGVKGCHTQGKNIAQARKRIRECLGLFIGDACETVELVDDIQLPKHIKQFLELVGSAASSRERAERKHRDLMRKFAKSLAVDKYSLQDVGELLNVSRQRVHQLLNN